MPKNLESAEDVVRALQLVGELLQAEGHGYSIAIIGGAALILSGVVHRATTDVDIIAMGIPGRRRRELGPPTDPLPEPLSRAASIVARDLGLAGNWLDTRSGLQWRAGLPPGFEERLTWRRYGTLEVGVVGHRDLVCFKLFAAAEGGGPRDRHVQDLLALKPRRTELLEAEAWVRMQDASKGLQTIVSEVIAHVRQVLEKNRR